MYVYKTAKSGKDHIRVNGIQEMSSKNLKIYKLIWNKSMILIFDHYWSVMTFWIILLDDRQVVTTTLDSIFVYGRLVTQVMMIDIKVIGGHRR